MYVYIIVPRLNDKDVKKLNDALFYSKRAYEEAFASKESSLRTENLITEFIKEQSRNNAPENSKHQKKHSWYTVSVMFPRLIYFKKNF